MSPQMPSPKSRLQSLSLPGAKAKQPPQQAVQKMSFTLQAQGLKPGVPTMVKGAAQMAFKPERIIIPDSCSDATVHAIRIGGQDQLVGGTSFPAAVFSSTASGVQLDMATAGPGQEIVMEVSRPQGGDFQAVMMGSAGGEPFKEPLVEVAEEAIKEIEAREAEEAKLAAKTGGST